MKKRIVCMLGLVLVLGLAGCGTKAQTPEETEYDYSEYIVEDTDITMEELRAVNRPTALMKEHESLGFTWENYDADENLQSTVEAQFIFFEGKLWYDSVMTDSSGNKTYDSDYEYSCAMKSHFRKSGNQMSGKWKSSYASLLA